MNLDNLSNRFWKVLDLINKLPEQERLTLCTLLTTVDHNNPNSECTYKVQSSVKLNGRNHEIY